MLSTKILKRTKLLKCARILRKENTPTINLANTNQAENPRGFSEIGENQQLLIAIVVRSYFYLDLCTSSSISTINSGNANPFTSSQEPVGNLFL